MICWSDRCDHQHRCLFDYSRTLCVKDKLHSYDTINLHLYQLALNYYGDNILR
jgi:hypothetical protein